MARIIEAEPHTWALLIVVMMLSQPKGVGSFGAGGASLIGRPTVSASLQAASCALPPRKVQLRAAPGAGTAEDDGFRWPSHITGKVANVWVLADKDGPPDQGDIDLCAAVIRAQKEGHGCASPLNSLKSKPVAVEFMSTMEQHRPFCLPGAENSRRLVQVRETSFGNSGLGYALWDAGVGLGIWLALNRDKVAGKRVLELGSGVGIGGVTAALVGAEAVVLTDFGQIEEETERDAAQRLSSQHLSSPSEPLQADMQGEGAQGSGSNNVVEEQLQPRQLLSNLDYTTQEDAEALVAAILAHTSPTGVFYLMNRRGRPGLSQVLDLLRNKVQQISD